MSIPPTGSKSDGACIANGTAMRKKVVLLLQGGGALGAFQCGAWEALSPFIHENGYQLIAVAGASIGAINAALIARHYHDADRGSGMLLDFWRNKLATPPMAYIPLPGEYWRAWNDLLTSWGTPHSFVPLINIGIRLATCSGFICLCARRLTPSVRYRRLSASITVFNLCLRLN
jgi:hypothetical protein